MIISHRKKFIFFCNGKTGTTSLEQALKPWDETTYEEFTASGIWYGKHIPPAIVKAVIPADKWNNYFKFVFVRNPYDWVVSQMKYNFAQSESLVSLILRIKPIHWRKWRWVFGRYQETRRLQRKKVYSANDVECLYKHLKRFRAMPYMDSLFQVSYVNDCDNHCLVDYIGRFENFSCCVKDLSGKIGIDIPLLHENISHRKPYSEMLGSSAMERISELWEVDFKYLGYSIES